MDPAAADSTEAFAAAARDLYLHATSPEENDPLVAAEWLDVSSVWPERLRYALRMFGVDQYRHIDCDLTKGLPLEKDSSDIMLCTEVVEHLEQPEMLVREFNGVIRPNGFLILTTPNEPSLPSRLKSWSRGRRVSIARSEEARDVGGTTVYGLHQYAAEYRMGIAPQRKRFRH
jgi:SAM-dependent methyltransferase